MRKSFDSLHGLTRDHLELDPYAGHLVVFTSRRRDRIKILYWDHDGFAIWSKRLEEGTYAVPFSDGEQGREIWITFENFYAISRYNRSPLYSLAVYQLSQAIAAGAADRPR